MDLVFKAELLSGQKIDCPACGRYAQVYKRHINCTIARQLLMLYKRGGTNYIHASLLIPEGQTGQGDLTKAKYFKLIEAMPEESEVKKSSGFWRLTEKGLGFIKGEILIPEYVLIFDDNVIGVSETHIDIKQSLASGGFNYSDLRNMASKASPCTESLEGGGVRNHPSLFSRLVTHDRIIFKHFNTCRT